MILAYSEVVATNRFFAGTSVELIGAVAMTLKPARYLAGEIIAKRGSLPTEVFLVVKGDPLSGFQIEAP